MTSMVETDQTNQGSGETGPHQTLAGQRPSSMDPHELGFTIRKPVAWLEPLVLIGTGVRVALIQILGAYLDKRELQASLPAVVHDETTQTGRQEALAGSATASGTDAAEQTAVANDAEVTGEAAVASNRDLWFDYTADLGDGFDPTYSVAYLLAQPQLSGAADVPLPRGQFLVLGGDEVYPTPASHGYEDRLEGPYRAALPDVPPGQPRPRIYALPGNHDWYDGLTAFLRLFARSESSSIGAWQTPQHRSYFALRLPCRWWLLAIDSQFGVYLDDPQTQYFTTVAEQFRAGDRIILCTPSPGWVTAVAEASAYDGIDHFVRTVIEPTGATAKLMLSGDLHHYARYSGEDRELITCGGGGAYLFPTHRLPGSITVPPPASRSRKASGPRSYQLRSRFPSAARSRRLSLGVLFRLPMVNPGLVGLTSLLHLLLMYSISGFARRFWTGERTAGTTTGHLSTLSAAIAGLVLLAALMLFAAPPTEARAPRRFLLGFGHWIVHMCLAAAATLVWTRLPLQGLPWPAADLLAMVLYALPVGLLATEVIAGYLLVASAFGVNLNELFASQAIIDQKSFLRMHIDTEGTLTVYPIGIDRACRRWSPNPQAAPDKPWFEPAQQLPYHLIEPPIRVR